MRIDDTYTGKAGTRYFLMRHKRRDPDVQRFSGRIFVDFIDHADTVVDFGCGDGGILNSLACKTKIGVEINPESVQAAKSRGLVVFPSLAEIPDESADVAITHHALEHVSDPSCILRELARILRSGSALVVVVPLEKGHRRRYRRWRVVSDVHLFSWNPLSLGNLVTSCGFAVERAFIKTNGYSRYNRWLQRWTPLFRLSEKTLAYVLDRRECVCVARKL